MSVRCFWLEPTSNVRRRLRRYSSHEARCAGYAYHNATSALDFVPAIIRERDGRQTLENVYDANAIAADRFPVRCERCEYVFTDADERQVFVELVYRRTDTGEEMTLRDAPPGAMWNADWMPESYRGPDGRSLTVKLPNGNEWLIDSKASNCTMADDWTHRCWVRHGEPPVITVDKNGHTCAAGAGSIQSGDYHGFLRNGVFEP